MFSCWVVGNLLYLWSFSLSLLPFTLTCTCIGKMNARWACGTYIQSTLSRVPLLEKPSSYLPFLYVTVNFVFSRRYLLLFSLFAIRDLSPRFAHPGQAAYFFPSLRTGRRDAEARRHGHSKYFTVSCSGALGCLSSLFFHLSFSLSWVPTMRVSFARQITKYICACEIHLILIFIPLLFVSIKSSRCYVIIRVDFTK